ncbi:MAG: biotin--[acetyl-CoA-carboxylase] ligase [Deltaproteobacteria bacterium]|nr:biotin--[acetyl-CoA-carboxylase] ligase [Deltaproteobacteria bacterium]
MREAYKTQAEIVKVLRNSGFVSGERVSASLGVSRTAVWKHIESLRLMGYSIDATPSKGYRLNPPASPLFNAVEVASLLSTEFVGRDITWHDSVASTNIMAKEAARDGALEGAAIVADSQTLGKGRMGRRWVSPAGVNLYTSIVLRPTFPPTDAHHLTFVSAVALATTADEFLGKGQGSLKWPNDLLLDSKKAGGILLEMDSDIDRVNFVIVGLGVNLNMKGRMFPAELRNIATSFLERGVKPIDRAMFTARLYRNMEIWYKRYMGEGFLPVIAAWRGFFRSEGKPVKVACHDRVVEGICLGLDDNGALLVRTASGDTQRVVSGDMSEASQRHQ